MSFVSLILLRRTGRPLAPLAGYAKAASVAVAPCQRAARRSHTMCKLCFWKSFHRTTVYLFDTIGPRSLPIPNVNPIHCDNEAADKCMMNWWRNIKHYYAKRKYNCHCDVNEFIKLLKCFNESTKNPNFWPRGYTDNHPMQIAREVYNTFKHQVQ